MMRHDGMRSPLAQARGLGSAKEGAAHWWSQRVTAVALVPLTIWFVGSLLALTVADHAAFVAWLRSPLNMVLILSFIIALFYHMALGLRIVVEDYVHQYGIRIILVAAVQVSCTILAITAITAVIMMIS